jgi:hypothetical protein
MRLFFYGILNIICHIDMLNIASGTDNYILLLLILNCQFQSIHSGPKSIFWLLSLFCVLITGIS